MVVGRHFCVVEEHVSTSNQPLYLLTLDMPEITLLQASSPDVRLQNALNRLTYERQVV